MPAADPASSAQLQQQRQDGVLYLTLNRPERRNALNGAIIDGLTQALQQAGQDRQLRAIVLRGAGQAAFCAGADLQSGQSFEFDYAQPQQAFANLLRAARGCHVPLIAYVNGACMAGGMGLLAMCDLAIAAPQASFGLPEVRVGLFPAQVLAVLQPLLPARVLTDLCLTGRSINAERALALELVREIDQDGQALPRLLAELLAVSGQAQRRGLYTLQQVQDMAFPQAMAFAESQIALFANTQDAREGLSAFREKRPPRWG